MAEYLLKQKYPELNIESAGISGLTGHAADDKAIQCMDALNIDMRCHIARKLNADMLKSRSCFSDELKSAKAY